MTRAIGLGSIVGVAVMAMTLGAEQPAPQAGREGGPGRGGPGGNFSVIFAELQKK